MTTMPIQEFVLRLFLATLFGVFIGLERQWRQKSAGLRTNTLVSMGSAAFILLSIQLTGGGGDPSRIAGQIITGIGFLGAGVIMKDGLNVHGLNTAATVWCSSAVGCLAACGLFAESLVTTVFVILAHVLLRPVAVLLSKIPYSKNEIVNMRYNITITNKTSVQGKIKNILILPSFFAQK